MNQQPRAPQQNVNEVADALINVRAQWGESGPAQTFDRYGLNADDVLEVAERSKTDALTAAQALAIGVLVGLDLATQAAP